ncbi:hypothetical protein BDN72DRAFT_962217 [Pluteus cervinus]|uniref:Uncharacterized protein n=1 Tax=Pluteus cervinus TaxID=181527 RepID=A0ACD3AJJ7_9AGAR|nr:hypothetical protein BDN72DRAFT_962217 [Pluteus cervinus]
MSPSIPQTLASSFPLRADLFATFVMDFVDLLPTEPSLEYWGQFFSAWSPPVFQTDKERDDYLNECWNVFCSINAFYLGCPAEEYSNTWSVMQDSWFKTWLEPHQANEPLCWMPEPYLSLCKMLDIGEEEIKMMLKSTLSRTQRQGLGNDLTAIAHEALHVAKALRSDSMET